MTQNPTKKSTSEFDLENASLSGHTLIEANAGTGKTYTISRLFLRLLLEKKIPASSILVVTFTEAATVELKERIHSLLRTCRDVFVKKSSDDPFFTMLLNRIDHDFATEQLTAALHSFDTVAIYTIHGFCRTVLTSNPFECGMPFQSEIITNQSELIREITLDFWRKWLYQESSGFVAYIVNTGFNPLKLIDLWNIASRTLSDIAITPDSDIALAAPYEQHFKDTLEQVRADWPQSRNEVSNQLNCGSLKGNIYKQTLIDHLLVSMDKLCKETGDSSILFDSFEKLTLPVLEKATKSKCTPPSHSFFTLCESLLESANDLNSLYSNKLLDCQSTYVRFMRTELTLRKAKQGKLYFDDLLLKVDCALQSKFNHILINTLHEKYHAALIDEFQDTDPVQYRIFSTIFDGASLFLIGDPKQSIYRFRGADIFTYLEVTQHVDTKFTLSKNYRSEPDLVKAINGLFCRADHLFINKEITSPPSGSGLPIDHKSLKINGEKQIPLTWICIEPQSTATALELVDYSANTVADRIANLISGGASGEVTIGTQPVAAHHIAVLVRKNSEATLMHKILSLKEIPSVIESSGSVFTTEEADELLRVLTAIASPHRTELIRSALITSLFGMNALDLEQLANDSTAWENSITKFFTYHDAWNAHGISYMMRLLMPAEHVRSRLLSHSGGERKLTNIIHLSELLLREEQNNRAGINALLDWFSEKINDLGDHVPDDEMLRLESDSDCVSIVTVHKSKGLQFPIVFAPFCWKASSPIRKGDQAVIVHSQANDSAPLLVLGKEEIAKYQSTVETETLAEEMRLLYVALTRSESCCYAVWCTHSTATSSAAAFLLFSNGSENPPAAGIKEYMKQLSHSDVIQQLNDTFKNDALIKFEKHSPVLSQKRVLLKDPAMSLVCRAIDKPIPEPWKIASFSSLSRSHHESDLINDDAGKTVTIQPVKVNEPEQFTAINMFPRGEAAGLFLHTLLEKVDLTALESPQTRDVTQSLLGVYNFDTEWENTLIELLSTIANVTLQPNDIQLKNVPLCDCITELQFHFPLDDLTTIQLRQALCDDAPDLFAPLQYSGEGLDFKKVRGYMKGFVDFLIKVGDKYFIIDWKSNHLGSSTEEYIFEILQREMSSKQYSLQYYIYTIAVNRYLSLRCKDYSYDRNFGGVYYLFLRGLKLDATTGIYFDRPDPKLITRLDTLFSGGKTVVGKN